MRKMPRDERSDIPRFARRPNVWLLFLEAIHSFEAAKEIYGIDASEAESFLRRQGFRIYAPFYSTTSWTVGSACALLTRYPFFDQFLPEYPIVLRTFRDNGYRMQVFDSGAYVFGRWEWLMDYASFALRGAGRKLFRSFLPLFAQSSLLRKAIGISDPYTSDVHTEAAYTDILNKVRLHGFVQDSSARMPQLTPVKRLTIAIPVFIIGIALSQIDFNIIWRYFGWSNQTLAAIMLWAAAAYLLRRDRLHWICTVPAVFITAASVTYICYEPSMGFGMSIGVSEIIGIVFSVICLGAFLAIGRKPVEGAPLDV